MSGMVNGIIVEIKNKNDLLNWVMNDV